MNILNKPLKRNIKSFSYICYFSSINQKIKKQLDYSKLTHYEILGLNPNVNQNEIKKKFLELAKIYHPDKYKGIETDRFNYIREAYEILRNPQKRKAYNKKIDIKEDKMEDFVESMKNPDNGVKRSQGTTFDDIKIDESIDFEKEYEDFMSKPMENSPEEIVIQEHPFLQSLNFEERARYEMSTILNNEELYIMKYGHQKGYQSSLTDNIKMINDRASVSDSMRIYTANEEIKKLNKKYTIIKALMLIIMFPFVAMVLHKRSLLAEKRKEDEMKVLEFMKEIELKKIQNRFVFD